MKLERILMLLRPTTPISHPTLRIPGLPAVAAPILVAGMFLGVMQTHATVVRGPMLQGASTSNIYVLAECTVGSSGTMTVNYGTTTSYGSSASTASTKSTSASPISYVHSMKLTGLQPNTLYHYQLTGQGFTSLDYTFRTLVNPGTSFRWVWAADFRSTPAVHNQIADLIRTNFDTTGPTPVLFDLAGGDFAIDNTYPNWTSQWITANEQELEKWKCAYLFPGNHEGTWGSSSSNMVAFDQPPDSTGSTGYYSFDCGDMHVTVGNYMDAGGYGTLSSQYGWIQRDVQASLKPWKIFGEHAPAYTYGGSGAHANDTGWQTITSNILQTNGVRVFLAGHNHFYQHVLTNGIHHIVCGGAGAPLYAVSSSPPAAVLKSFSSNCFMVVDVNATNLHMVAYDNFTNVLETIDLWKLPAPTNVVANSGDSQVTLNWNTVTGATNYTVRFGTTDGGPYSTGQAVTAPPLTRTALTNGTAYYFVVSAVDSNGPSAISSQVSATPSLSPAQLDVSPTSGLTSGGNAGGPFSPPSQIYTLTNFGGASLSWSASNSADWLTLSATSGNLAGGNSTDITVSINATANGLAVGSYSDTVSFTNASNGAGNTTRAVSLIVNPLPAQLSVSPSSGLTSGGPVGGSFSPSNQVYTLSNTGSVAMDWTVSNSANWLSLSATSGNLAGGDSTNITVLLNASANGLAAGSYSDTVSFTNVTSGLGNTTRSVSLTALTPFQVWQMQFFTCTDCPQAAPDADPLGKGMSNMNQFLAGLNPTNPASVFRITSVVTDRSNNVLITWSAAGVRTNAVQASVTDANGDFTTNFLDLATAPQIILPIGGDTTTNYVDVGGASNGPGRYYRIRLVP